MLIQQYRKRSQTINSLRPLIFFINSRIINFRIRKYNSRILKFLIYSITTSASSSSTA